MRLGNSDLFVIELNIIYFFMFRSQNMTPKASTEVPRAQSGWEIPSHISLPPHYRHSIAFSPSLISTSPPSIFQPSRYCSPSGSRWTISIAILYFSSKTYGSNFTKQHSETVMVWNYQNGHYCVIYCNFRHTFVLYAVMETVIRKTITYVSVLLSAQSCIQPCKC